MDPTGRLGLVPSAATLVVPKSFGLGRAAPEVVAKVGAAHAGEDLDLQTSLLLPSKYRARSADLQQLTATFTGTAALNSSSSGSNSLRGGASQRSLSASAAADQAAGEGGAEEGAAAEPGLGEVDEDEEGAAAVGQTGSNRVKPMEPLKLRPLTKLESDLMAAAHKRHKDSIAVAKVGGGLLAGWVPPPCHASNHGLALRPSFLAITHPPSCFLALHPLSLTDVLSVTHQEACPDHCPRTDPCHPPRHQTAMGVTLSGDAWLASASPLEFLDFEAGRSYTAAVSLINTGPVKNTLRLEALPPEVCGGAGGRDEGR